MHKNFPAAFHCSNDTLIDLIQEYKASDLYRFHEEFDGQEDMPGLEAAEAFKAGDKGSDWAVDILYHPNHEALL